MPKRFTSLSSHLRSLGKPKGKKVALLGLAFKPNTDDVREAPSLKIAKALLEAQAHVSAFDPVVKKISLAGLEVLECANSIPACLSGAHCCVVITEWEQFKALTPDDFIEHKGQPVVVDARRIFDPRQFRHRLEFSAVGFGDGASFDGVSREPRHPRPRTEPPDALEGKIVTFMSLAGTE
jgi:UDPglucose 6-dehydrogenase